MLSSPEMAEMVALAKDIGGCAVDARYNPADEPLAPVMVFVREGSQYRPVVVRLGRRIIDLRPVDARWTDEDLDGERAAGIEVRVSEGWPVPLP